MKLDLIKLLFLIALICLVNAKISESNSSEKDENEISNDEIEIEYTDSVDIEDDSSTEEEEETTIVETDTIEEKPHVSYNDIRLPKTVLPRAYRLDFATSLKNSTFGGIAEIDIEVVAKTNFIVIHSLNLDLSDIELSAESKVWKPVSVEYIEKNQYYILIFNDEIKEGNYTLKTKYSGQFDNGYYGYYLSSYKDNKDKVTYLATTQFEPTSARKAFPCFDEPEFKATFQLNMTVEDGYNAISNMNVIKIEDIEGSNEKKYIFANSVKMSTYLVAFVVSDFDSISTEENGFPVSVYTRPDQIEYAKLALRTASKVLKYYEKIYKIPYALPKLDLIAIPDFATGAMENWGLITFRETYILIDESQSSVSASETIVNAIAHELAHQWFGNLVTMKWWDDLWLNEGFANFMAIKGTDYAEPEWKTENQWYVDDVLSAYSSDSTHNTHAIYSQASDPEEIFNLFDQITYYKGSSVIRMIESWLNTLDGNNENIDISETYFFKKIYKYLDLHKFDNAKTEELWEALESYDNNGKALIGVSKTMNDFIRQPGFPIVMMNKNKNDNNTIILTQERYLLNRLQLIKENEPMDETKWNIPFTYMIYSNATGKPELLETESIILEDKSEIQLSDLIATENENDDSTTFVKGNYGQNGYYKVQYDDESIKTACEWLKTDLHFMKPIDRAGFLHDIGTQLFTGRTNDPETILDCFNFLKKERSYIVWTTGINVLSSLLKHFDHYEDQSVLKKAYNFVASLIEDISEEIGWKENEKNNAEIVEDNTLHNRSKLRNNIIDLSLTLGIEKVKEEALNYFKQIKNGTFNENFDDDIIGFIHKAGVKYGDESDFEYVYNKYLNESYANRKQALMIALTNVKDVSLKPRIFEILQSGNAKDTDAVIFFRSFISDKANVPMGWKFIKENYEQLLKIVPNSSYYITSLLSIIVEQIDSESLKEIVSWFNDDSDPNKEYLKVHEKVLLLGIEKGKSCIYWIENENLGGAITNYLNRNF
ncbi:hypothetical protein LY90DRAFT_670288 [Neocallimastix californiae]|uniref:Aminopeptidase n=1 Tax=Neocallimastix californiae TaxID=1754190 RepID=A0A1Y2D5U0_9FUNG|nr:hypothetical protein LY90DRAFT_670288 [Neocallimastix californiae]|eukprot:ORY53935.1 hypothetical protein LY90DRAFT_670288 [Neocallimastix californiae]